MAELINKNDSLNDGRKKLNEAIKDSNQAKEDAIKSLARSLSAEQIAQLAELKADDTQEQLDNIIIESGTSDAEVVQARGNHDLLYKRLDSSDSQLAQTVKVVNVKNFGVKGDGISDDTSLIQKAINNLDNGDILYIPKGEYRITDTLICDKNNITIEANGATILNRTSSKLALLIRGSINNPINATENIALGGKTIVLGTTPHGIQAGDYIKITTSEKYTNVVNRDYKKGEIIRVSSVSGNNLILNYGGTALGYNTIDYQVTVSKINLITVSVKGLNFKGTGSINKQSAIRLEYTLGCSVEGCSFEDLNAGIDTKSSIGNRITNCSFKDLDDNTEGYGIVVSSSSLGNIIQNNFFDNCRHGVTTGGYDGVCLNTLVANNTLINCVKYAPLNNHGNSRFMRFIDNTIKNCDLGILVNAPCTTVSGNTIANAGGSAIRCLEAGAVEVQITNNNIKNSGSESQLAAIDVVLAVLDYIDSGSVVVSGNHISNSNGGGIRAQGDFTSVIIENNSLDTIRFVAIRIDKAIHTKIANNFVFRCLRNDQNAISITGVKNGDMFIDIDVSNLSIYNLSGSSAHVTNNHIASYARGINISRCNALLLGENILNVEENFKTTLDDVGKMIGKLHGRTIASGNGNNKEFAIPHALGQTPTYVDVTPSSVDSMADFYVKTLSDKEIKIEYKSAPQVGVSNLKWFWEISAN